LQHHGEGDQRMTKAIGCLSGGLDSMLAIRLIQLQGIDVLALHALHPWHAMPVDPAKEPGAVVAARQLGVPIRLIDATEADLAMIQNPKFGLGKRMNPCIDCRIWVLRQAKAIMEAEGAAFVFTGEVVGQRPMSQRRPILNVVEREAGLEDLLVRPLSAKQLSPTKPERDGLLDRTKLRGIIGRSRHEQIAMAAEFGITEYPSPAGGCLLTDPGFALRLRELIDHKEPTAADVQLLKVGRHFRLDDGTLLVIGRHEDDNVRLLRLLTPGDVRIEAAGIPGPTSILRGSASPANTATAASLTLRYTKTPPGEVRTVLIRPVGGVETTIEAATAQDDDAARWIIMPKEAP
jgi:tRNA U34 2-thiouridine synthase MnmA/TrmU